MAISNFGFGGSNVHCILGGAAGRAQAGLAIAPAMADASAEKAKEVSYDHSHQTRAVLSSCCSILCGQAMCAGRAGAALTYVLGWASLWRKEKSCLAVLIPHSVLFFGAASVTPTHAAIDFPPSTFGWRMTAPATPDLASQPSLQPRL